VTPQNKNLDIECLAHDAFIRYASSGTIITYDINLLIILGT